MKEVNNLLNRLGELDDAPLIWVNKKVYDMAEEIERLNNIINEFEKYLEEIKDRVIMYGIDDDTYKTTNLYRDIKLKIKELKGVDKE